ncbi:MAG: Fur family transcriptional regulator [Tissierellia bacterium]|nr:Fur family transcriptional regulator [Tissierellia bacterium]
MELPDIYRLLKEKGVRPSRQRVLLYLELARREDHPTAESLFRDLKLEIPTLSKTTIYNTMKLFSEKKLVQIIQVDGRESRFAISKEGQGYFYCRDCQKIYDLDLENLPQAAGLPKGAQLEDVQVVFKGRCGAC